MILNRTLGPQELCPMGLQRPCVHEAALSVCSAPSRPAPGSAVEHTQTLPPQRPWVGPLPALCPHFRGVGTQDTAQHQGCNEVLGELAGGPQARVPQGNMPGVIDGAHHD
jgi:hypothetical protein